MFSRNKFYKWRFKHPESDWSYEEYLAWAYKKDRTKLITKLLIAGYILTLIIGIAIGIYVS